MNKHRRFWALWGWPIVMGVLTTTGLLTALVSDTWGDGWSCAVAADLRGQLYQPITATNPSGTSGASPR